LGRRHSRADTREPSAASAQGSGVTITVSGTKCSRAAIACATAALLRRLIVRTQLSVARAAAPPCLYSAFAAGVAFAFVSYEVFVDSKKLTSSSVSLAVAIHLAGFDTL